MLLRRQRLALLATLHRWAQLLLPTLSDVHSINMPANVVRRLPLVLATGSLLVPSPLHRLALAPQPSRLSLDPENAIARSTLSWPLGVILLCALKWNSGAPSFLSVALQSVVLSWTSLLAAH